MPTEHQNAPQAGRFAPAGNSSPCPGHPRLKEELKAEARQLGLDLVGVAGCGVSARDRQALADREARGFRSSFEERDIALRVELDRLLPGCQSAVVVGMSYLPGQPVPPPPEEPDGLRGWLSRYCRGQDYHQVLREKLRQLSGWLTDRCPRARTYLFADTEPPIDRSLAEQAGLGFFGRSANLITREYGTWVFLGGLLTDVPLEPDPPWQASCGTCTRCLEACPTGAIVEPYVIDSLRCLSYVTQMKGYIPPEFREPMGKMLFGCDICQDVCPYNLRPSLLAGDHPELNPWPEVGGDAGPLLERVLAMANPEFRAVWQRTAAGWRGKTVLQRNAVIALGNSGDPRALPPLQQALGDQRPLIRGHAAWALARLADLRPELAPAAGAALRDALERETDAEARREMATALARLHPGAE